MYKLKIIYEYQAKLSIKCCDIVGPSWSENLQNMMSVSFKFKNLQTKWFWVRTSTLRVPRAVTRLTVYRSLYIIRVQYSIVFKLAPRFWVQKASRFNVFEFFKYLIIKSVS